MRLRIKNLGIIETAEIDISKPLIIFSGPNGTGKTYLSYIIDELPRSFAGFLLSVIDSDEGEKLFNIYNPSRFETENSINGTLPSEVLYALFKRGIKEITNELLSELNLPNKSTSPLSIEVASSLEEWKEELFRLKLNCGYILRIHKESNTFDYTVTSLPELKKEIDFKKDVRFELTLFLNSIFFCGATNSIMFTAERSGIALFSTEIAVSRLRSNDRFPRYPRPISDELADSADRVHKSRYTSDFDDLADEIEKDVLHGNVSITKYGELRISKHKKEYDIAVASSTAKALADIVFYIRHRAGLMSRLLIDEPEIHLHPDNQILLTRIFARMVNRGLQLLISTHSEYIIREINNLIMLSNSGEGFKERAAELGYKPEEYLRPEMIQPYLFVEQANGKVKTQSIQVSKEGFAVDSIDKIIASLNDISEEVYYAMLQNQ